MAKKKRGKMKSRLKTALDLVLRSKLQNETSVQIE